MIHDTPRWRIARNDKLQEWLGGYEYALRWVLDFGDVCEVFDDFMDQDKAVSDHHLVQTLIRVLVEMPANPFWIAHRESLETVILVGINAWADATRMERKAAASTEGHAEDLLVAYTLRNWYAEIVHVIIYLVRGREEMLRLSSEVRMFFGATEGFTEYQNGIRARKNGDS